MTSVHQILRELFSHTPSAPVCSIQSMMSVAPSDPEVEVADIPAVYPDICYHYTNAAGYKGIQDTQKFMPSTTESIKNTHYGKGVYLTPITPIEMDLLGHTTQSSASLPRSLLIPLIARATTSQSKSILPGSRKLRISPTPQTATFTSSAEKLIFPLQVN